ncbi:hypothetical protein [Kitasatospora phosalacinea]|uniref:Secreted protein n=1 Tax=Kitasatospora phosalacinea TaxID=2065 RepID=A0ABW6GDY0_9ACTN
MTTKRTSAVVAALLAAAAASLTLAAPASAASLNNDGVFNNVISGAPPKTINRPALDQPTELEAESTVSTTVTFGG